MPDLRNTELFHAMKEGDYYDDEAEILHEIEDMRADVANGISPEETLHDHGLEPDYILDLL